MDFLSQLSAPRRPDGVPKPETEASSEPAATTSGGDLPKPSGLTIRSAEPLDPAQISGIETKISLALAEIARYRQKTEQLVSRFNRLEERWKDPTGSLADSYLLCREVFDEYGLFFAFEDSLNASEQIIDLLSLVVKDLGIGNVQEAWEDYENDTKVRSPGLPSLAQSPQSGPAEPLQPAAGAPDVGQEDLLPTEGQDLRGQADQ